MKFEKYNDAAGQWRWRLRARNGKIIASGEGYRDEKDCDRAIEIVKASASAPVRVTAG